jgi:CBS domain containing-hemolysin-like protein
MSADPRLSLWISLALVASNAFFVAAEYGLIGARRSRIESLARQGNRAARALMEALADLSRYVAGIQIAITMCGIGIGAVTEPIVTELLVDLAGDTVNRAVSVVISVVLVTFVLVVVGELVPKYVTLQFSERVALLVIRPLKAFVFALTPLVWLVQRSGALILRPFGIKVEPGSQETVGKDELMLLVKAGGAEGLLDEFHAQLVARALKFDVLDAADIMVHRLDVRWLDIGTPREEVFGRLAEIQHSRVPVCRGEIDEVAGVLYLHDLVRFWNRPEFSLEAILRPVEAIPESLKISRIIERMREAKTQILIVRDEYGGVSGLVTLEDVIEEVFGEIEDQLESERPSIERVSARRISARADVRYDELLEFLGIEPQGPANTDTLAQVMIHQLDRMPRLADAVDIEIGRLRVENMARRRITRVALELRDPPA